MEKNKKKSLLIIMICIVFSGLFSIIAVATYNNIQNIENAITTSYYTWLNDIETDEKTDTTVDSYDKASETYTVQIPTYGLIGPFIDTEENTINNVFDIDNSGASENSMLNDDSENHYDYQVLGDSWDITIPTKVAAILSHSTVISPYIRIVNDGNLPAEVSIVSFKDNTSDENYSNSSVVNYYHEGNFTSQIELVENKDDINLVYEIGDPNGQSNKLYLGVMAPIVQNDDLIISEEFIEEQSLPEYVENAFSSLEEKSLANVSSTNSIYLGRLGNYTIVSENDDNTVISNTGVFQLDVKASPNFVVKWQGKESYDYDNYDNDYAAGEWTFKSYASYIMTFSFELPDSLKYKYGSDNNESYENWTSTSS